MPATPPPSQINSKTVAPKAGGKGNRWVLIYVLAMVAVIIVLVVIGLSRTSSETQTREQPLPSQERSEGTTRETTERAIAEDRAKEKEAPQLGKLIEVSDFAYTINEVKWKSILGEGELVHQRPDAAFLIVDVTVVNKGRKPHYLQSPQLVDSSGRTYTSTNNALIEQGSLFMLKEFNPQVRSRGTVVFDVPYGSYSLRLFGGEDSLFHRSKTVPIVVYR
jgi:hypothetical protein